MLNKYTYINLYGKDNIFNKYLHPLGIMLSHRLKLIRRKGLAQINIGLSDNFLPIPFIIEYNSKSRISIYTNFEYNEFYSLKEKDRIDYLLCFLIKTLFKITNEDKRVQTHNILSLQDEFKLNDYSYVILVKEKISKTLNTKINLIVKLDEFIYTCEIQDKINKISYSVVLIRLKPDLIRLNRFLGNLKIIKNNGIKYSNKEIIFHVNTTKQEFCIESQISFEYSKQYISRSCKNWPEFEFLLKKIKL